MDVNKPSSHLVHLTLGMSQELGWVAELSVYEGE